MWPIADKSLKINPDVCFKNEVLSAYLEASCKGLHFMQVKP